MLYGMEHEKTTARQGLPGLDTTIQGIFLSLQDKSNPDLATRV